MRLEPSDPVDLAVMAAIISNFTPDRVNPLWFVLIASSEAGKSMLLDVILEGWEPVWKMPTTISPGYFFSGRTSRGALARIDGENKRLLYMRDMAALTSLPQVNKALIHNQIIGIYDGELQHETGMTSQPQTHKRDPQNRLGWIGAATEAFYDRFLLRTYAVGARFTAYYWQSRTTHWTDTEYLRIQRDLRASRLSAFHATQEKVQAFLTEAIAQIKDFPRVQIAKEQGRRIDDATALVMRIVGSGKTSPAGGRTSDRATQFARSAAFLAGERDVEPEHADLGVKLVLSQLGPEYQHLLGYAVRPENIGQWWRLAEFLEEIGGRRIHYSEYRRGGPLEHMADVGVLQTKIEKARKFQQGDSLVIRVTEDALKLIRRFDPALLQLPRQVDAVAAAMQDEAREAGDDDPAEISLAALAKIE